MYLMLVWIDIVPNLEILLVHRFGLPKMILGSTSDFLRNLGQLSTVSRLNQRTHSRCLLSFTSVEFCANADTGRDAKFVRLDRQKLREMDCFWFFPFSCDLTLRFYCNFFLKFGQETLNSRINRKIMSRVNIP